MKPLLIAVLILTFTAQGSAQSTGFGRPLLWYTEDNPWVMFIGADGPTFAVYGTGQVIYWKDKKYHLVELSAADLQDLLAKFQLTDTFFVRSRWVGASEATDQSTYTLRLDLDTLKQFSIYGYMRDKEIKAKVPAQLRAIYDLIHSFEDDGTVDWMPDKIEIMLSPYDNAMEPPIRWPNGWPDLESPGSRRWQDGGGSIFIDKRYFPKLRRLLASRKEKQAFLISGKTFFAGYRLPLPGVDSVMALHRPNLSD